MSIVRRDDRPVSAQSMRWAYLAVIWISGWLAVPARPDRARDAEILILGHRPSRSCTAGTTSCA